MNKYTRHILAASRTVSICAIATLAMLSGSVIAQERQVLDRVIALVDEGVILQSEYDARLQEILQRAEEMDMQLPPPAQLREQVMENLIIESLQLQLAERVGIRFDDDTLNRVMTDMARQNNMTFEQYVDALESQGVYLSTRERIRKELAVNEVQRGMVNRRINITDQEIGNYLNSESGRDAMAPDYLVDQILIPVLATDSPEVERAKEAFANDLRQQIGGGEDFADVRMQAQQAAAAGSARAFAVSGGELGWRKADRLPTLFADIVPDMTTGAVSEPIRSSNGFHLIKLSDVRGDSNRLVKQTEARHVLIAPNEIRTEDQARRLAQEVYERIDGGEDFNIVARQLSDDTQSVVAGGDLGWVSDGGMPPEFAEVVSELDIGELSEPFRTSFGWHVAEVTGRREQDLSREYRRQQATNALRERKFDVELENWMLEIRDEAYVKIIN
ncbi:peptidylprolyl isomerase [Pseudohongiella acticola]|jgi:peptidyl-prolyl cis-trans isomerase SurA|uniref:peptidylprolyl isomerase n=1 Tax=Pseudohongiella acticola TaxID=1524254 RepID=UPI0030EF585F